MEAQVSPKIIDAVLAVRKNVKKLSHNATNPHANYKYASIDKYYTDVVPLANEAGLVWKTRQTKYVYLPNMGKGRDRTWVEVGFAFDLYASGAEALDYATATVVLPLEGAQTTGQTFSYAEKCFMRSAFSVPTGEGDADSEPAERDGAMGAPPLPAHDPLTGELAVTTSDVSDVLSSTSTEGEDPVFDPRKVSSKGVDTILEIVRHWLPDIKTRVQLRDWNANNVAAFEAVQRFSPEKREKLRALMNARNVELTK